MENRLLILGSLGEFVQLIKISKARGIYTIVCDGYPNSIGKKFADKTYDIDVGETERIAAICKLEKVDGIITSFSDYLFECMVKIADRAGLECYFSKDKLDYYRNKTVMKQMFTDLSIPTPRFTCLDKDFMNSELSGFRFPVVVKPLDKYGSRGVLRLDSPDKIREKFEFICQTSSIKKILVEEYNDGFEFNMMTWILDKKVKVISIADREKTPIEKESIPISTRNVYPSCLMDHVYEQATAILQKVADYTGQTDGALSMQFFWNAQTGIQVCEVAGRFFGYEHELVEYSSGLCIENLLLDYVCDKNALKKTLLNHDPYFSKCSAVLYFHGKPGLTVADQYAARSLSTSDAILDSWLFYKDGEMITQHGVNPYVARYYITAGNREQIDELTQKIYHQISITDVSGNEILYPNQITKY